MRTPGPFARGYEASRGSVKMILMLRFTTHPFRRNRDRSKFRPSPEEQGIKPYLKTVSVSFHTSLGPFELQSVSWY